MYIFKCKCGGIFTLSPAALSDDRWITCQECGQKIRFCSNNTIDAWRNELAKNEIELNKVPDTAKIGITYSL